MSWGKRTLDCVIALSLLLVLSPLLLATSLLIRVVMGRPVLFRQARTGMGGRSFEMMKFRTMREAYDERGCPLPDEARITPLGAVLRRWSIDELPELANVLRGEMSLVGPRPLPVAYLDRYTREERRRHDVRPGLSGWAQINGRNLSGWDERLAMDVWYVDNRTLVLDLKILVRTVISVLRREGIAEAGHVTMTELPPGRNH